MKLLFDQGTPAPLRRRLPGHSVDTLAEKGWSEKSNGELLDLAPDSKAVAGGDCVPAGLRSDGGTRARGTLNRPILP